jgi:archaellum component FlaC
MTVAQKTMDQRIGNLEAAVKPLTLLPKRVDRLDTRLGAVEGRLVAVEDRLTGVEGRLIGVEGRLTDVESQIVQLRTEMKDEFSAVRREMHQQGDELREDIASQGRETAGQILRLECHITDVNEATRQEMRALDAARGREMRVLHEEIIDRLKRIGERPDGAAS